MKYKIEIWQYHSVSDTYESNHIEDILGWYRLKWDYVYERGLCTFYVYEDCVEMTFDELYALGFYE